MISWAWGPYPMSWCLYKERERGRSFSLFMHTYRGQVTWRHCKKLPSPSQEESSHHSSIMLAPSPQPCHLQNCEKRSLCSVSHPLYVFCYNSLSRLRQSLPSSPCPSPLASFLFPSSSSTLSRPRILLQLFFLRSPFTLPPLSTPSSDNLIWKRLPQLPSTLAPSL